MTDDFAQCGLLSGSLFGKQSLLPGSQSVRGIETTHPIAHPRAYFWYLK